MTAERVARLERRLERERRIREQAEQIAEDGLRDLYLANQDLDRRVAERTSELEAQRVAAAASAEERSEFLRLLSRETRSPLNGVLGVLEMLVDNAGDDQERLWATSGLSSAQQLEAIMTRLLVFVDLDAPISAPFDQVDVDEILRATASKWERPALRTGKLLSVENRCSSNSSIRCVRSDLGWLLDEVLSNAVKHADAGPLKLYVAPEGERVRFTVIDAGPGIAAPQQLLSSDHDGPTHGAIRGLGYALMKKLAARTGAELSVNSSPGESTVVDVLLDHAA